MSDYYLNPEQISQHVVKLAIDLAPVVTLDENRPALQNFANGMIGRFPDIFETLVSGPQQFRINKTFQLGRGKAEIVTLAWTARGALITVPKRLFISGPHDIQNVDADEIFTAAVQELGERFPDRGIPRVTTGHNLVVDTGEDNSMDVVASWFSKPQWQSGLRNARIQLQNEHEGKTMIYDIRPTYVSPGGHSAWPAPEDARFGVVVNVDMAIGNPPEMIESEEITELLAFAKYYVPRELMSFLNGET